MKDPKGGNKFIYGISALRLLTVGNYMLILPVSDCTGVVIYIHHVQVCFCSDKCPNAWPLVCQMDGQNPGFIQTRQ